MSDTGQVEGGSASRTFERILLVKPSSLGDVVHALPVLRGLRLRYPRAVIHWLIAPPFAPLLEGNSDVDELVIFDRARFARLGRSLNATAEFFRFLKQLKSRRYDLVIDLQGLFRSGFLSWATGARVRVGLAEAREGAGLFYTHRLSSVDSDTHAVDRYRRVGALLGFEDEPVAFDLHLSQDDRDAARKMLSVANSKAGDRVIVVAPGGRWETKRWLPERLVQMVDELQQSGQGRCVLVGGEDDVSLCGRIARDCCSPPLNLAGETSIRQLAAVLAEADCVVCHDSAAMHLAVALSRPLVCLIGPTNPSRTGPYGRPEDVVKLDLPCSPCYLRKLSQCPHAHQCMNDLPVSLVVGAVGRAMEAVSSVVN